MIAARVEALHKHKLDGFTCGDGDLDDWLHRKAKPMGGDGLNRTHLWIEDQTDQIIGYFALAPCFAENEIGQSYPSILLAKLALHQDLRGNKPRLGPLLIAAAFETALRGADLVGGRFLAVDAMTQKNVDFYLGMDFEVVQEPKADDEPTRLLIKLSTLRKSFQA
ncbi:MULTISPECIES: hypothetical protein [unclassified Aeromicrobium]|uniref:hypothetical protein n=1 Tax=unclassified Aeromicrobium TaxID=2633570 RepID=UPI00396B2982